MRITHLATATATILGLVLSACGSGGGGNNASGSIDSEPTTQSFGLLKPAETDGEMADSIRKGLAGVPITFAEDELTASPMPVEGAPDADGAGAGGFSATNLQEAGVDEADRVKYDGDILYVLNYGTNYDTGFGDGPISTDEGGLSLAPAATRATIRLLRTDTETPAAEEVSAIEFESNSYAGGLYLATAGNGKQLLNVANDNSMYHWGLFAIDAFWLDRQTEVRSWDVSDAANPSAYWSVQIDGSLLTSRIVDQVLYLVTRYTPTVEGLLPYPANDAQRDANQALLDNTALADLLPDIARNDGEPQELLAGTDCYVPNNEYPELPAPPASGSLITVTAIDLEAPDRINSICLNGFASGFYVSQNSLYVTSYGADNRTLIHKVSLGDGNPQYRGSGDVPGYLGTRNPAFLMSESGDDLRVVSSTWEDFLFPVPDMEPGATPPEQTAEEALDLGRHFLTVLRENPATASLDEIARIPNSERPRHIGKPGEDLYAARFLGDRAYLVTFQTIDPLYVVNLSNPEDPSIAGELELPGFSTLLQPLGDGLLLGVGQEVSVVQGAALPGGVKVALFDVANIANPVELASAEIGKRGSYSPALDDHHALTLLDTDGTVRLALPVSRHEEARQEGQPWAWYDWTDDALHQFEVDPASGSLLHRGALLSEQHSESQQWPSYGLHDSRAVLHDDAVFFITADQLLTGRWGE